jgi:hypothetical protein
MNPFWPDSMTKTTSAQLKLWLFTTLALCPEISIPASLATCTAKGSGALPGLAKMPADETDISGPPSSLSLSLMSPSAIGLRQIFPVQTNNTLSMVPVDFKASFTAAHQKSMRTLSPSMALR